MLVVVADEMDDFAEEKVADLYFVGNGADFEFGKVAAGKAAVFVEKVTDFDLVAKSTAPDFAPAYFASFAGTAGTVA
jgi:hypothetical protein